MILFLTCKLFFKINFYLTIKKNICTFADYYIKSDLCICFKKNNIFYIFSCDLKKIYYLCTQLNY